jgi:hypothetical protein
MYFGLVNKLLSWSSPNDMLMIDCLLKLCKCPEFNVNTLCDILKAHADSITSNVMKALLKYYLELQDDDMSLTLFNMCINGLFPKFSNKEIDFPSDQMRKLLIIQAQKM